MVDFKALVPWRDRSQTPRGGKTSTTCSPLSAVDRMFDDFFNGCGARVSRSLGPWQGFTPTMDLTENEREIVVTAEFPGLVDKDFEVTVAGDLLTLKGEKKAEQEHRNGDAYYVERRFGAFSRSARLPSRSRTRRWTPGTTRAC